MQKWGFLMVTTLVVLYIDLRLGCPRLNRTHGLAGFTLQRFGVHTNTP